jgi:hypothetical protein
MSKRPKNPMMRIRPTPSDKVSRFSRFSVRCAHTSGLEETSLHLDDPNMCCIHTMRDG